jgi:hypothetical protein
MEAQSRRVKLVREAVEAEAVDTQTGQRCMVEAEIW